ncbi:hypothetical protein Tco_0162235 [Tanacetum coccineum]
MTRSSTKELLSPFENQTKFCSERGFLDTPSLVDRIHRYVRSHFDIEEQSEEEVRETMTETMDQCMSKTQGDYGSTICFELPVSLTGAASRWLRNQPSGSITTWEVLKTKFLNKYCPPARTAKKMEEINNFQQEPDESLFRAWERFKIIGAIPSKTAADAKIAIQEMAEYSQKWHNGTSSRTRSTETSDGLAAIQAQLNNLGREIKKVNEKVYAAQVGCELCKGPHYTKDCPQKEEGKTLEEAYYTQFGAPYQPGGQYRAARPGFYQRNNGNSSYLDRRRAWEEYDLILWQKASA